MMQVAIAGAGCDAQMQAARGCKRRFATCICASHMQGGNGAVKNVSLVLGFAQSRTETISAQLTMFPTH
jgi:hypothetical protein